MVKVFIQEKVGSKLAWAIRKVISVGAIRKVISVGAEYRQAVKGKCKAIVLLMWLSDFLKLVYKGFPRFA
jgi:hypothetical protein